jgi:hypothetical protein
MVTFVGDYKRRFRQFCEPPRRRLNHHHVAQVKVYSAPLERCRYLSAQFLPVNKKQNPVSFLCCLSGYISLYNGFPAAATENRAYRPLTRPHTVPNIVNHALLIIS